METGLHQTFIITRARCAREYRKNRLIISSWASAAARITTLCYIHYSLFFADYSDGALYIHTGLYLMRQNFIVAHFSTDCLRFAIYNEDIFEYIGADAVVFALSSAKLKKCLQVSLRQYSLIDWSIGGRRSLFGKLRFPLFFRNSLYAILFR